MTIYISKKAVLAAVLCLVLYLVVRTIKNNKPSKKEELEIVEQPLEIVEQPPESAELPLDAGSSSAELPLDAGSSSAELPLDVGSSSSSSTAGSSSTGLPPDIEARAKLIDSIKIQAYIILRETESLGLIIPENKREELRRLYIKYKVRTELNKQLIILTEPYKTPIELDKRSSQDAGSSEINELVKSIVEDIIQKAILNIESPKDELITESAELSAGSSNDTIPSVRRDTGSAELATASTGSEESTLLVVPTDLTDSPFSVPNSPTGSPPNRPPRRRPGAKMTQRNYLLLGPDGLYQI